MKGLFIVSALFLAALQANAADCPVQFGNEDYLEKVGQAIDAAPSCWEASQVAESCALGASGDAYTVPVAIMKCEADFYSKLDPAERATYSSFNDKCDAKYAGMDGTMYISFNAFCHLSVSKLYSELYTPAEE